MTDPCVKYMASARKKPSNAGLAMHLPGGPWDLSAASPPPEIIKRMISCRRTGDFRFIGRALSAPRNIHNFIAELFLYDIRELTRIARMLRHWKSEIINSFDRVNGQRISNGPIESVNSRIKVIKQNGNGYRNFERFKLRVLYSLNDNSSIKS